MKRSAVAALALLLLLCCGADEFGSFQIVNPSGVASPEYQEYTWLFTVGQDTAEINDANLYAATGGAIIDSVIDLSAVFKWDDVSGRLAQNTGADSVDTGNRRPWYDDWTREAYAASRQGLNTRLFPVRSLDLQYGIMYWPLEDYLPANCTISSAMVGLSTGTLAVSTNASSSYAETLMAVLDTLTADRYWMTGPNTGNNTVKFAGKCAASFYNQIQPVHYLPSGASDSAYVNARAGYPGVATGVLRLPGSGAALFDGAALADSYAWSPPLASRTMTIDWGPRGSGWVPPASYSAGGDTLEIAVDCTRPVQYIVRGAQNSGLWLLYSSNPNANRNSQVRVYLGPSTGYRKPFMAVTWKNKRHQWPWPGDNEVAFSFRTDDAVADVNDTLSAIFGARGLSYTIGVIGYRAVTNPSVSDTLVYAGQVYAGKTRLLNWFTRGMELVSHGRQHDPGGGTAHGVAGVAADLSDDSSAGGDSLYFIMQPGWLDSLLGSESATMDSSDFAAHRLTGRGYLFAQNVFTLRSLLVADSLGYVFCGGGVLGAAAKRPAPGDSMGTMVGGAAANVWRRSYGISTPRKMNRLLVPNGPHNGVGNGIDLIFGTPGSAVTDSAAIKKSIKGWIENYAVCKQGGYLVFFTHNLLSSNHSYTADGINPDQARWMLNALAEAGNVWVANMGDVSAFWTRNSQQSDSPADQGGGGQWDVLLVGDKSPWYQRTGVNQ